MDEIILTYPNVALYYHAPGHPCSGPALFKEIESGKYAYRLTVGQKLESIRYHDVNKDIFVHPTVLEIQDDGLVVAYYSPFTEKFEEEAFMPFKKSLPAAGVCEMRDMYIVPCGELYEKNKLADVLAGTIATESWVGGKLDKDYGEGIWHMHGGRRTMCSRWDENLRNFIKAGQQNLF